MYILDHYLCISNTI